MNQQDSHWFQDYLLVFSVVLRNGKGTREQSILPTEIPQCASTGVASARTHLVAFPKKEQEIRRDPTDRSSVFLRRKQKRVVWTLLGFLLCSLRKKERQRKNPKDSPQLRRQAVPRIISLELSHFSSFFEIKKKREGKQKIPHDPPKRRPQFTFHFPKRKEEKPN